jgi:hypothetical protein
MVDRVRWYEHDDGFKELRKPSKRLPCMDEGKHISIRDLKNPGGKFCKKVLLQLKK